MSAPKNAPTPVSIGLNEIKEFASQESDFAFEMKVLKIFKDSKSICLHGGIYHDPKSDKTRQFDIRVFQRKGFLRIYWAIECKNIRDHSPILAHLVRRDKREAFNDVIIGNKVKVFGARYAQFQHVPQVMNDGSSIVRLSDSATLYNQNEWVAKSVDQVTKDSQGKFKNTESLFYEKSSQAIHSAYDLIQSTFIQSDPTSIHFIVPVLVVPDDRLWAIRYQEDGTPTEPKKITEFQSYWSLDWEVKSQQGFGALFSVSHLEVIEFSQLKKNMDRFSDRYCYHLYQDVFETPANPTY